MKIILTGATGMVGEGVLMECLENDAISEILMINRKQLDKKHPKLKELIVPDFMNLQDIKAELAGYDACFYCAGISSVGMDEAAYHHITYEISLNMAHTLKEVNPDLVFNFVSGSHTDSSEKGKSMWARVKGKTENSLMKVFPGKQYNFRPGLMKPTKGQQNFKGYNQYVKILYPIMRLFFPSCSIREIALAMIKAVQIRYEKNRLEVKDIKILAHR